MNYKHCPTWPVSTRIFKISPDIARAAIKKIPSNKVGKDLKFRLNESHNYSFKVAIVNTPKRDETWLLVSASWVTHAYSLGKTEGSRIRSLVQLVDSW